MYKLPSALLTISALLMAAPIVSCTLTGNVSADSAAFAANVAKYNQGAGTLIAQFNSGLVTDTKAVGQMVCANSSELHGLFGTVAAPLVIAGVVDPTVAGTEAGAYATVKIACGIIDNLQASPEALAQATAQVITALPQIQNALKTAAPDVAAIALAPVAVVAKAS